MVVTVACLGFEVHESEAMQSFYALYLLIYKVLPMLVVIFTALLSEELGDFLLLQGIAECQSRHGS